MKHKPDDIDRILEAAKRFGVKMYITKDYDRQMRHVQSGSLFADMYRRVELKVMEPHRNATSGPRGHWCHPKTKSVWWDSLPLDDLETVLHEVCHVLMDPPGGIEQLSEDVVLMPFERTLAKQILSKEGYDKVVDWQVTGTQIEWWDTKQKKFYGELSKVPNYTRWWHWRQSFKALRAMGALDRHNRITWRWPNWNKAPSETFARGNLIAS